MEAENIKKNLIRNSIINSEDILSFIPVEASFSRKDYRDRQRYLIEINGVKKLVLRIAENLSDLIEKHELISKQFPKLIPAISLYYKENGRDFVFEEFIQGETLESIIRKDPGREKEMVEKAIQLHESMNEKLLDSSFESACKEIEQLIAEIASLNFVTDVDAILLKSMMQPDIIGLLSKRKSYKKRISQGDFIDRNIILTEDGVLRVIDLEFTQVTHFYKEEIIRLYKFSDSVKEKKYNNDSIDLADEIFFLLNQIVLVQKVNQEFLNLQSFDNLVYQALVMIRQESERFTLSRIIKILHGDYLIIADLKNQILERDAQIVDRNMRLAENERFKDQYNLLTVDFKVLSNSFATLSNNYNAVLESISWKLGSGLLWPINKIISLVRMKK